MLNELAQVVTALKSAGLSVESRHPAVQPLRKNQATLVVCLGEDGLPSTCRWISGADASTLLKINHPSAGSSFPGFNLTCPLRSIGVGAPGHDSESASALLLGFAARKPELAAVADQIRILHVASSQRSTPPREVQQFKRSTGEHAAALRAQFSSAPADAASFVAMLDLVARQPPDFGKFLARLADVLVESISSSTADELKLASDALFGFLDWKKRKSALGTAEYGREKAKQDRKLPKLSVYLELQSLPASARPVAHPATGRAINAHLVSTLGQTNAQVLQDGYRPLDAFGRAGPLQVDGYPEPMLAELGKMKLFSVNAEEVRTLYRYGLSGGDFFPVSAELVQQMSDALLALASEGRRGISCHAIPAAQSKNRKPKRDLLVVFLESAPEANVAFAELFGAETLAFTDRDFRQHVAPVRAWLNGSDGPSTNAKLRLFVLSSLNAGWKQISLSRDLTVADLATAAARWESGAANVPSVSIWFRDKERKENVFLSDRVPTPIDLVSALNRVWSSDHKLGFTPSFARAFSVSEAYDLFLGTDAQRPALARRALELLLARSTSVFGALAHARSQHRWSDLSDTVRLHASRCVGIFGILLHALDQTRTAYMNEPTFHLGRLLALADQLHLQYCQHVRDGKAPSQLIGNALFSTALDQPVFALARLAERIGPYQSWARTFHSSDPAVKWGWEKTLLRQFEHHANQFLERGSDDTIHIRVEDLPSRMTDTDKAKLLLGYLSDPPQSQGNSSTELQATPSAVS